MDIIQISLCAYLTFASTYGAYYLAKNDLRRDGGDITLFDVMGNSLPSILFSWFIFPMIVSQKIVIKKGENKSKNGRKER